MPAQHGVDSQLPSPLLLANGGLKRHDRVFAHYKVFKTYYGPTNRAFAALDETKQAALQSDMLGPPGRLNRGGNGTLIVPSEYLEIVITKR